MEIDIKDIKVVRNIRTEIGDVSDLMQSIRENGLLEPVGVCKIKDEYVLVYGHRRFSALKKLGRKQLTVGKEIIIVEKTEMQDLIILNTVENYHRKENTPLEFAKISSDLKELGLSTTEIAVRLGCSKNKINVALKLLDSVPEGELENVSYGGGGRDNKKGKLPANVASAIADNVIRYKIDKNNIEKLYKIAREKELSTQDIRLLSLGMEEGLTFSESIKLPDSFKNKQIDLIININELEKLKTNFKKYIISCLKGEEEFNKKLLY